MIFFSRLEFVPAQINGQKNTIAARGRGLWVGCTAVLLYSCTEIPVRCRQIQYVLHLSTPHLRTLVWLFLFTVPLASEVVLNGGRAGASGPRPSGALVIIIFSSYSTTFAPFCFHHERATRGPAQNRLLCAIWIVCRFFGGDTTRNKIGSVVCGLAVPLCCCTAVGSLTTVLQ